MCYALSDFLYGMWIFSNCFLFLRISSNLAVLIQFTLVFVIEYKLYFVSKNVNNIVLKGQLPQIVGERQFKLVVWTALIFVLTVGSLLSIMYIIFTAKGSDSRKYYVVAYIQMTNDVLFSLFAILNSIIIAITFI